MVTPRPLKQNEFALKRWTSKHEKSFLASLPVLWNRNAFLSVVNLPTELRESDQNLGMPKGLSEYGVPWPTSSTHIPANNALALHAQSTGLPSSPSPVCQLHTTNLGLAAGLDFPGVVHLGFHSLKCPSTKPGCQDREQFGGPRGSCERW